MEFSGLPQRGLDIIPGLIGDRWAYNAQTWLGLGIGVKLFNTEGEGKKQ